MQTLVDRGDILAEKKRWGKQDGPIGLTGSAQHGIRTPPRTSTVGQPSTTLGPPAHQPPKGRPGTKTRWSGQHARKLPTVFLGFWDRKEETVLLEVATPLEATVTIDEETAAKLEAQRTN